MGGIKSATLALHIYISEIIHFSNLYKTFADSGLLYHIPNHALCYSLNRGQC